jgi:hypothetical protein
MIALKCPHCAKGIRAPDEQAGKRVRCPGCKEVLTVPAATTAVQSAPIAVKPKPPPLPKRAAIDDEEPVVVVPVIEETDAEDDRPRRARNRRREEEDEDDDRPRRRRSRYDDDDEEDEDDRPRRRRSRRRRGAYADCPNCDAPGDATQVSWTLWGGLVGPWLLTHVRCNRCGYCYNGKSGKSNTTAIILYIVVPIIIAMPLIICGALGALMGHH